MPDHAIRKLQRAERRRNRLAPERAPEVHACFDGCRLKFASRGAREIHQETINGQVRCMPSTRWAGQLVQLADGRWALRGAR
jgi:hypothetical protein